MSELALEHVHVVFGEKAILNDITLPLPSPGVMVLMGPGGAGKTTLLRSLSGLNEGMSHMRTQGGCVDRAERGREVSARLVHQRLRAMSGSVRDYLLSDYADRQWMLVLEQRRFIASRLDEMGLGELGDLIESEYLYLNAEQKQLFTVCKALLHEPELLCMDEPFVGLGDWARARLMELIRREGTRRTLLISTHHQATARQIATHMTLLVQGRLVESAPASDFFERSENPLTLQYLRTGGCYWPVEGEGEEPEGEPTEEQESLTERIAAYEAYMAAGGEAACELPEPIEETERVLEEEPALATPVEHFTLEALYRPLMPHASAYSGPQGFCWLVPGRLAGVAKPGLMRPVSEDLQSLERMRADYLVTLTEEPLEGAPSSSKGLHTIFFPIVDMEAPALEACEELCAHLAAQLTREKCVVFHCKAGLGRTGTMLAAMLIWHGEGAERAITYARSQQRYWIQSTAQEQFLHAFEHYLEEKRAAP